MLLIESAFILCMASTAWHEARSEGIEGMTAVMEVVHNRAIAGYMGATNECDVAKAPKQFSSFNSGYSEPVDKPIFLELLPIARKIYTGKINNLPNAVMHYHTTTSAPYWRDIDKIYKTIGSHIFYAGIK